MVGFTCDHNWLSRWTAAKTACFGISSMTMARRKGEGAEEVSQSDKCSKWLITFNIGWGICNFASRRLFRNCRSLLTDLEEFQRNRISKMRFWLGNHLEWNHLNLNTPIHQIRSITNHCSLNSSRKENQNLFSQQIPPLTTHTPKFPFARKRWWNIWWKQEFSLRLLIKRSIRSNSVQSWELSNHVR